MDPVRARGETRQGLHR